MTTVAQVINRVAGELGVDRSQIIAPGGPAPVSVARAFVYLDLRAAGWSTGAIAHALKRDHVTVSRGIKRARGVIDRLGFNRDSPGKMAALYLGFQFTNVEIAQRSGLTSTEASQVIQHMGDVGLVENRRENRRLWSVTDYGWRLARKMGLLPGEPLPKKTEASAVLGRAAHVAFVRAKEGADPEGIAASILALSMEL